MASAEEREKIMAEFMSNVANDGDDDEEDLGEDPEFDEDDSDDDEDGDEDDDDDEPALPVILKGSLSMVKEDGDGNKALVYSGTWASGADSEDTSKFKLRSKVPKGFKSLNAPNDEGSFDGYFVLKDADGSKTKVNEKNVVLKFSAVPGKEGKRWIVNGEGVNDFGPFDLTGEYRYKAEDDTTKLHLEKKYRSSGGGGAESDSADDDFDDEDKADEDELNGLEDDANLSIDELRKRAYGGGEGGGGDGEKTKKKTKKSEEDEEEGEF